ncbi:MAG: carboxypeptidase-like regulatory domain-containing protein, partial [Nannocystaceae bacterium]
MSAVEPDRRTKLALCFSVAAMFVLAVIAIHFRSSSDTAHRSESKTDEEAAVVIGEGDAATPGVIVGRVFLENKKKPERDRGAGAPRGEASTDGGDEPAGTSTGSGAVDSSGEGSAGARDGQGEEVHVEPASGCVVTLWRSGQRLQDGACTGDGRFRLELAEGAMEESPDAVTSIEITVPRYLRASLALTGEEAVPLKGVGNTLDLGDVALGSAVPLRGVVLDAEGEGVADVVVEAMPIEHLDEPEPWRARTNAAGEFEYRTLPRGPLRIELRDPRYAPSVVEAVAPYDAVVLPVSRYKTVTGEVDLEAIASAGAMPIVARIQGSGVWPPRTVKVAEDGSFRFEEIPDGVYAVEVLAIAEGDKASFVSDIVEGVMPDQPVSLTLRPAGWIRVQVTDTDGQPLPGARVTAGFGGLSMLQKVG